MNLLPGAILNLKYSYVTANYVSIPIIRNITKVGVGVGEWVDCDVKAHPIYDEIQPINARK